MFDIKNISILSNLNVDDVINFLPDILHDIREYTHKSFITNVSISGNITISNGKIISPINIPNGFVINSQIELRYSLNNTKIYTIKNIKNNIIETYEKLFDEEFNGFIIRLSFNEINDNIISSMINYKKISIKGIKSESIDGYTYELSDNVVNGYPIDIMSSFNYIKQLPGTEKTEYFNKGYYLC